MTHARQDLHALLHLAGPAPASGPAAPPPALVHSPAHAFDSGALTIPDLDVRRSAVMAKAPVQSATGPTITESTSSRAALGETLAPGGQFLHERIAPGERLGRYRIVAHLGAGAMGVVYLAHDPELERKVAIKLLRQSSVDERDRLRLIREAQAMAKVSHPNVVVVHEVASHDEQVFVVMEYVPGATLRTWLKGHQRGHEELLALFVAVGRGLAAAHAAGVIHRDFKPDNVLIGDDGRPRVTDFGLARAARRSGEPLNAESLARRGSAVGLALTRAGAVLGTPLYMAPEQWTGAELDARCDQFAFCAALWEAVFGESAFAGETVAARMSAVTRGELRPPTNPSRAPAWVRAALERGLAVDPAARWPSMDALLGALARDDARRRRRRRSALGVLGLGALALALATPHALAEAEAREEAERCAAAVASLDDTWGTAKAAAILRANPPLADAAADRRTRALRGLYRDAAAWRSLRREACAAPPTAALQWKPAVVDDCFADAADDLRLRAEALAAGDLDSRVTALTGELDAARCLDDAVILSHDFDLRAEAATADRWRALRDEAARALAKPHPEAARALTAVAAEADEAGLTQLSRELRALVAGDRFIAGERLQALEVLDALLREAPARASALRVPSASVRYAVAGSLLHGAASAPSRVAVAADLLGADRRAELEGGLVGAYIGEAADDDPLTQLEADARLLLLAGDHERAAALARQALARPEAAPERPAGPAIRSALLLTRGRASLAGGDLEDAAAALDEALTLADPTRTSSARRGYVHLARAELSLARADVASARAELAEATELRAAAERDDDLYAPELHRVQAALAVAAGDDASAREALREARFALLSTSGFARARLAEVDRRLAELADRAGATDEAAELRVEAGLVDASLRGHAPPQ